MEQKRKDWDETRREPLRSKVRDARLLAQTRVDYYGEKSAKLIKRLRWFSAVSGLSALAAAGLLPWLPRIKDGQVEFIIVAAVLALVSPALLALSKTFGWAADLATWQKAENMARFIETELEDIETRLYLHDYNSVEEMLHVFRRVVRRWEFVLQTTPSERQDDKMVKRLYGRAKVAMGINGHGRRETERTDPDDDSSPKIGTVAEVGHNEERR